VLQHACSGSSGGWSTVFFTTTLPQIDRPREHRSVVTPCLTYIVSSFKKSHTQIIAFHVGDRSRQSARRLWAKIPQAYRQHATFYTDQYVVYEGVIPAAQHKAINKLARKTNHIERFNNTLRQRVSRLVRETLSFSKKLANHIGAIKYFICYYNLTRTAA
jgi:IS1 family transposase